MHWHVNTRPINWRSLPKMKPDMSVNIHELLQVASARLQASSPSPGIDAHYLLMHVLNKDLSWLRLHEAVHVSLHQHEAFDALLARRMQGEPIAYITGSRGFWTLDLEVNRHTLIPRPETEMLVEFALEKIPKGVAQKILDLGTGSGAIALAIKKERPFCTLTAVDVSAEALLVAQRNAERLELPIEMLSSDWFSALPRPDFDAHGLKSHDPEGQQLNPHGFDMVLANPPYIDADDMHLGQGDVRFEPLRALVSASKGLHDITIIAAAAPAYCRPGAWLAFEHGYDQGAAVRQILQQNGYADIATRTDLSGHERISFGRFVGGSQHHVE